MFNMENLKSMEKAPCGINESIASSTTSIYSESGEDCLYFYITHIRPNSVLFRIRISHASFQLFVILIVLIVLNIVGQIGVFLLLFLW